MENRENDLKVVYLYQAGEGWGLPNISPFCIKLELFFKIYDIPYEVKSYNPFFAPRKKMPYIQWNGSWISDTETIIDYLSHEFSIDMDSKLSLEQKRFSHSIRRMLEDGTYFTLLYNRWLVEENWKNVKKTYFGNMPFLFRDLFAYTLRKQVRGMCYAQGISRYSSNEIQKIVGQDINTLVHFMTGETSYFKEGISRIDLTVFSIMASIMMTDLPVNFIDQFKNNKKIINYLEFYMGKYFSAENAQNNLV